MGRPLFRCDQEWCDANTFEEGDQKDSLLQEEKDELREFSSSCPKDELKEMSSSCPAENPVQSQVPRQSFASKSVCCLWLRGTCPEPARHVLKNQELLHEDVRGLPCSFGMGCYLGHYKTRNQGPTTVPEPPPPPRKLHTQTESFAERELEKFVCCLWLGGRCREAGGSLKDKRGP